MEQSKQIEIRQKNYAVAHQLSNELEALSSAQIRHVPLLEFESVVMQAVHKAFKDRGQFEIDPDTIDHIVNNLSADILKACPFIRIAEIPIAIEKGILGDYGDFYGLNVITFVKFIKSHYNSLNRANLAKQLPVDTVEKQKPTEEEEKATKISLILKSFEAYKLNGFYQDYGNYIYKSLKEFNVFSFSEDQKLLYLSNAKRKVLESLKNDQVQKPFERNKIKQQIQDLETLNGDTKAMVYRESLQIALMDFYKNLVEMDAEIKDLITENS